VAAHEALRSPKRRARPALREARNLLLLLWVFYLIMGFVSRQGLGLLDAFGGIFVVSYLDILARIGFGVLVLRATDATDQVIESLRSSDAGDDGSDGVTSRDPTTQRSIRLTDASATVRCQMAALSGATGKPPSDLTASYQVFTSPVVG